MLPATLVHLCTSHTEGSTTQLCFRSQYLYLLFCMVLVGLILLYGRQPVSWIWPAAYFCSFIRMQIYSFICMPTVFTLIGTETIGTSLPKMFTISPFIEISLSIPGLQLYAFFSGKITPCISLVSTWEQPYKHMGCSTNTFRLMEIKIKGLIAEH